MKVLNTFSFVKSFNWHSAVEWTVVDLLTSSNIMPLLKRMNFALVINVIDLVGMNNSALFRDFRHIDVHYVFIINDERPHIKFIKYVQHGSRSHPREIASATFICGDWPDNQLFITPHLHYVSFHFLKNYFNTGLYT